MNAHTETRLIPGPAGVLELALDHPAQQAAGVAVLAHPHPLFGGTLHNKVVQTLARACVQQGWCAVRFNFRGVGASSGVHDHGVGEVDDLLAVVQAVAANGPLVLGGFSFGGYVAACAAQRLMASRVPQALVLVGPAASRFVLPTLADELAARTLIVHGEQDDTVPLAAVLDWARPQSLPVTVVPGGEHFFHGRLPLLKRLVMQHLRALA
ncbi:MAG: alpha/beta fold hydrolase [Tepidimonas sp.]|uniref:alpha/beta hydrolase n=1 Tax=Tepidimonas sp. TaxID=2002775 RepID=UPI00298F3E37|nr:alpha/beta fold hydrolase [Tepidimonas sp.]MCX7742909.1 alpha/beta fold hydrolase [Tepidimonas sp.]MDW8336254.1 alpha/beta fold hydrolase [Tepidimonas sp.]